MNDKSILRRFIRKIIGWGSIVKELERQEEYFQGIIDKQEEYFQGIIDRQDQKILEIKNSVSWFDEWSKKQSFISNSLSEDIQILKHTVEYFSDWSEEQSYKGELLKNEAEDFKISLAGLEGKMNESNKNIDDLKNKVQYFNDFAQSQSFEVEQLKQNKDSIKSSIAYLDKFSQEQSWMSAHLDSKIDQRVLEQRVKNINTAYDIKYLKNKEKDVYSKPSKIIQVVDYLNYGDAIGNSILEIDKLIKDFNIETGIYTIEADKRIDSNIFKSYEELPLLSENDIMLYHLAIGTFLPTVLVQYHCKKVLVYRNVTPVKFFKDEPLSVVESSKRGIEQARFLSDKVDYSMTFSDFSRNDLIEMGYKCDIDVMPMPFRYNEYAKMPKREITEKYKDGKTNILFVGRVAPNKKHDDLIESFACYKKNYNLNSRLILVGSFKEDDSYYKYLIEKVVNLNLGEDVLFTNHVKPDELLAYFKISDVFLCLSEHEGFCVPLIEAMYFEIPIVAYKSTAIPETLGGTGILLEDKHPEKVSEAINKLMIDEEFRNKLIEAQLKRLDYFKPENVKKIWEESLAKVGNMEVKNSDRD